MSKCSTPESTNSFVSSGSWSLPMRTLSAISAAQIAEKTIVFSSLSISAAAESFNLSGERKVQSQQWVSIRNLIQSPRLRIHLVVEIRTDVERPFGVPAEDPLLRHRFVGHQPRDRCPVPRDDDLLAGCDFEQQP